jgi:hypothetical protein
LEALQQEVDTLNNERRDLREKLKSNTKRNLIENLMNKASPELSPDKTLNKNSTPSNVAPLNFNDQEVIKKAKKERKLFLAKHFICLFKYLKIRLTKYMNSLLVKNNAELRQYLASKVLLDLPPLPKVNTEENFVKNEKDYQNINSLMSKSNDLMKVLIIRS